MKLKVEAGVWDWVGVRVGVQSGMEKEKRLGVKEEIEVGVGV